MDGVLIRGPPIRRHRVGYVGVWSSIRLTLGEKRCGWKKALRFLDRTQYSEFDAHSHSLMRDGLF